MFFEPQAGLRVAVQIPIDAEAGRLAVMARVPLRIGLRVPTSCRSSALSEGNLIARGAQTDARGHSSQKFLRNAARALATSRSQWATAE